MKLYTRSQFIDLPAGTIYKKIHSDRLEIKGEWVSDSKTDWSCATLAFDCDPHNQDNYLKLLYGESLYVQTDCYGRDGMFEEQEEFLIYEKWDLEQLRAHIDQAIALAKMDNP